MSEYKEDLKINLNQLHREWAKQPLLYAKWAEKHAEAMARRDRAKEEVELTRAEQSNSLLENWEIHFDKKPTVDAIRNKILTQTEYEIALKEYLSACEEVNTLAVAKTAFDHRKKALENEVKLFLADYYSKEDLGGEDKEELQKKTRNRRVAKTRKGKK